MSLFTNPLRADLIEAWDLLEAAEKAANRAGLPNIQELLREAREKVFRARIALDDSERNDV